MNNKTLDFYRDGIRELRAAGIQFASASNGYSLRGDLSSGQKSAISRALSALESEAEQEQEEPQESGEWYSNAIDEGSWDDIDWFDYDLIDDFTDEEADSYDEGDAK